MILPATPGAAGGPQPSEMGLFLGMGEEVEIEFSPWSILQSEQSSFVCTESELFGFCVSVN